MRKLSAVVDLLQAEESLPERNLDHAVPVAERRSTVAVGFNPRLTYHPRWGVAERRLKWYRPFPVAESSVAPRRERVWNAMFRGLKPTATIMPSLRDKRMEE